MKILKLRLLNLNSLSGEWAIDFTSPEFSDGGLFAITGPTGVGKTTILDGICLALYGRTPRLAKVNKNTNEIMSRGRGECAAELTFETPAGRWRGHWSQRRANKKPDGALQPPRHEIVDDQTGQVLESLLTKTLARVETVTGMNFEQFTRSMMLAQGAFAAFLEAPPDDRADLLEQITGADIYTAISIRVHERKTGERKKLEALKDELKGLTLGEGGEEAIVAEEKELQDRLRALDQALTGDREAQAWLKTLAELTAESRSLAERDQELAARQEKFRPEHERLQRAREAVRLDPAHSSLQLLRRTRDQAALDLDKRRRELPETLAAQAAAAQAAARAAERLAEAKAAEEAARPLLTEVRALDVRLLELGKQLTPIEAERRATLAELARLLTLELSEGPAADQSLAGRVAELKAGLDGRQTALTAERRRLKELLAGREAADWRDQVISLSRRADLLDKLLEEIKRRAAVEKDLADNEKRCGQAQADLTAVTAELKTQAERVTALETDAERLAVIWDLQMQLRSFEDWRHNLEEGRACPLCGSVDHPYAVPGNIPAEKVSQANLKENKDALKAGKDRLNVLTAKESSLKQLIKGERDTAARLTGERQTLADWRGPRFASLGLTPAAEGDLSLLAEREARETGRALAAAAALVKEVEKTEKGLFAEETALKDAAATVEKGEGLLKTAAERMSALEALTRQRDELARRRAELFGARRPEAEENALRDAAAAADSLLTQAAKKVREAETGRDKVKALIEETDQRLRDLGAETALHQARLQADIQSAGFDDEAAWLAARLPDSDRARLETLGRELSEARAVLDSHRQANAERLGRETARRLTDRPLTELSAAIEAQEAERRERQARLGAVQQKLADYRQAARKHSRLLTAVEAQANECRRWDHLHELIGSADGRKYRNFAQSLTFEILVGQANRQLVRLSDRYLLICDEEQPLELKVIDNYQAGEIRSAKNLSGGESFLVSLALALGLSQMASRRVRVDSLFLDEGFGTLDEDALELALETLAGLREEGKLIGVISHIPAMMNRIATQIVVRPKNGPHSEITGPGVSRGEASGPILVEKGD